jgi:LacI family transcriptional regulator
MKRISQRDIAKKLGVNVSTVSRALNGLKGVSESLKQKIEALAKDEGYSPNPFAASLRYDTTRTIGVVVPDIAFNHFTHIIKRIESEAQKAGYLCIITDSNDDYENEKECLEHLVDMHVDGIAICLSQETTDYSHLQYVRQQHIPSCSSTGLLIRISPQWSSMMPIPPVRPLTISLTGERAALPSWAARIR